MTIRFWSILSPRRRKIVFWALGLLLFYAVTGFFILPPIIRAVAVKELSAQLERKVSIQSVKLDPFVPSVAIHGLLILDKDGQPFVSWDEVYVDFEASSVFGKAWTFREIRVARPFLRAQLNKDYTFNFSDLIQKFSTNSEGTTARPPGKPLLVWIKHLTITDARVSVADLTQQAPFKRIIGPMDFALTDFRTEPDKRSSYWFAGTTDTGENFYWRGRFCLNPLSSQGRFSLGGIRLSNFAALYQDFVPFKIRDGVAGLRADYRFALSASNRVATVSNAALALWNFKVTKPPATNDIIELPHFAVMGVNADAISRRVEIGRVMVLGAKLFVERGRNGTLNIAWPAKPAAKTVFAATPAAMGGGIPELLASITNSAAMLLGTTNQGIVAIRDLTVTNCALHFEDLTTARPAKLFLDNVALEAKNISNVPATNQTVALSLTWNGTGKINVGIDAGLSPLTADVHLRLKHLDLSPLDPYVESQINLLVPSGNIGLDGDVLLRTPLGGLPAINFRGSTRLDDFRAVDSVRGEDLLGWKTIQVSGIDAKLNPMSVSIKRIYLDEVTPRIVIETNGSVNLLLALRPAGAVRTNAPVAAETMIPPGPGPNAIESMPPISIGDIVFTNTQIYFTDRSVDPTVNLAVLQGEGLVSGITTAELQHGDIHLHAMVDGVGPVSITGRINPFSGSQTNLMKITLQNMDLLPASPYSGKFAGYRIARGGLDLDLDYKLVGRKLEAQNLITLDQFTFGQKVASPTATKLPVKLAIAILRDREGKIVLNVPIEGSLDDPKFRIGKVVVRALENILTKVAVSPFSLLGAAFGGGGEELSYDDFAPGSTELTAGSRQKLDVMVKALYNRPGLNLVISGSVNAEADRGGLQRIAFEKLLRLRQWQSLRESERDLTTPDEIVLTPEQRIHWINSLYDEALAQGKITPSLLAANTNLAAIAARIKAPHPKSQKLALLLSEKTTATVRPSSESSAPPAIVVANPKESLLMAMLPVPDSDLETLAMGRSRAVRDYLLESGKVAANRLSMAQNKSGGLRADGSRVYLQLE